ncbi:hypothetical protein ACNKHM_23340 [Shigella sonnei]
MNRLYHYLADLLADCGVDPPLFMGDIVGDCSANLLLPWQSRF